MGKTKGTFIYTGGAKGYSKTRQNLVSNTNSIFMFDKEQILVIKILGNQRLVYYQLAYLKLFSV